MHRRVITGSANGADYLRSCDANKYKQIHKANDKMDKDERGVLCGTQFLSFFSQFWSYLLLLETEAVTGEPPVTVGSAYDANTPGSHCGCQRMFKVDGFHGVSMIN